MYAAPPLTTVHAALLANSSRTKYSHNVLGIMHTSQQPKWFTKQVINNT